LLKAAQQAASVRFKARREAKQAAALQQSADAAVVEKHTGWHAVGRRTLSSCQLAAGMLVEALKKG
jgi:hypothetical protein